MNQMEVKYTEEATELIGHMEETLLQMEARPEDENLIQQVFRDMHTLKGNSAMLGFRLVADFTHHLESIYDSIRTKELKLSKEIIDTTLNCLDHLSHLINSDHVLGARAKQKHDQLMATIIQIANSTGATANKSIVTVDNDLSNVESTTASEYHIQFAPHADFLLNGSNPLYMLDDLYTLGDCKVIANTDNIPPLNEYVHDVCYTSWDIYLNTTAGEQAIKEVFEFVLHKCELSITLLQDSILETESNESNADNLPAPDLAKIAIPEEGLVKEITSNKKSNVIQSIRVPSERLDHMMSLVSELMTLQAKLSTIADQNQQLELRGVTENLEKISTRLRDNAFSMCLIPVENMITPFKRLVRTLSTALNKEIEFVTEGTETELDKNIMEGLSDPLMHLLRNSIDHGIEYPRCKIKNWKTAIGKILIRAFCAGTHVYIEIQDDGKGIDVDKSKRKSHSERIDW
jgi:two-component system chemotaxis sensor kinase CheA